MKAQRNPARCGGKLEHVLARILTAAMLATLLPMTVHAQVSQDPIAVGTNGNVRINGYVGINTPAVNGQNLHIAGSADSMPLNITDPKNEVNWLSVFSNGNVVINGRNLGIGASSPEFPLTFSDKTGDKISFNGGDLGFGVAKDKALQIHTNANNANIVFGWGKSDALTELMRIKGTGQVGIGTDDPKIKLDVNGGALFREDLTKLPEASGLVGSSSALYFTNTKHTFTAFGDAQGFGAIENSQNYQSLMILGRKTANSSRIVRLWDRVGIGGGGCAQDQNTKVYDEKCVPQDALDVNGNVRVRNDLYVYQNVYYYDNLEKHRWVQLWGRNDNWLGWKDAAEPSKSSDSRLKRELQPIPSALDKVDKLRGVTYRWNGDGLRYLTRDIEATISAGPQATVEQNQTLWQAEREKRYKQLSNTQVGVVAQDVEAVLPEAVTTDESGYKSVRYDELIPLLIEAVKELESKVKQQSQTIAQQQQQIADLGGSRLAAGSQREDLAAVKSELAVLQATVQRLTATQLADAPDVTHTSGPKIH
jgi:hypothetical protein